MIAVGRTLLVGALTAWAGVAGAQSSIQAEPGSEIQWYYAATPPLFITEGRLKGQGYLDRMLDEIVIPSLPEFRHRRIESAMTRALADVQRRPDVCVLGLYKTAERVRLMHFSQPFATVLPISVTIRAGEEGRMKRYLDARGRVKLREVLQAPDLRLGLVSERSYGPEIDAIVGDFRDSARIERRAASEASRTLLERLERKYGIDVVVAYPYELSYLSEIGALRPDSLRLLPIAEAPASLPGYMACSRSPLGEVVVARMDQLFGSAIVQARFQALYERWLDEAARKRLRDVTGKP